MEQEELVNLTFKPQLTAQAAKARSVLQLAQNPEAYLDRIRLEKEKAEKRNKEIIESRQKAELEGCTFRPQTIDCPAYIKRIARSLSVVKAAKAHSGEDNIEANSKPQWK
jgi:hypothetical protein